MLPVIPATKSCGSTSPSESSGTLASSTAVAKQPGCATCGVASVRGVLGNRAAELRDARGRAVPVLVHALVGGGRRVAEVGGDVDDARPRAGRLSGAKQPVDQAGRDTVRRSGQDRRHRVGGDVLDDLVVPREAQMRQHGLQVREELRDRRLRAGCRTQRRPGRVADARRAAAATRPRHSRCRRERSPVSVRLIRSPPARGGRPTPGSRGCDRRAARPTVSALQRVHAHLLLDDRTPTALSVAGPVTAHGSMSKRSRSSLTPPHAATGSFADRMTADSARRMSGAERIASTP